MAHFAPGFLNKSLGPDLGLIPDANFKVLVSSLSLNSFRKSVILVLSWFWQKCLDLGLQTIEKMTVLVSVSVKMS